jgi:tRNA1Val (adenine37-N6)-methyltransferase
MSGIFRFKQFNVDQTGCAMKVNTDGVLLGALVNAENPLSVLDIGTGTGVIALMLAQRFANAKIDAVEIDTSAAKTAGNNFTASSFADRLNIFDEGYKSYFESNPDKKYDLIVSNPPFHIHSLKSQSKNEALAKHADELFFEELINSVSTHLKLQGIGCLILPLQTADLVKYMLAKNHMYVHKIISLYSFEDSIPHREIIFFGPLRQPLIEEKFVIYGQANIYSAPYREALKDFLTIF